MKKFFTLPMIIISAFFALLFVVIIIASLSAGSVPGGTILKVELDGPLHEVPVAGFADMFAEHEPLTLRGLDGAIRAAAVDEDVVGMVLEVKSPQIGVAQLQEIETAMAVFRESGKWNVAFLETAGELSRGDGAYALACSADQIVLTPPGEINLVGLRAEVPFLKGTLDKLDVEMHMEKRHAYKNAANMFTEESFTAEHREALTEVIDDMQTVVVEQIAARRGVEPAAVRAWMAKGPYGAAEAKELGLVDEVGYWDTILSAAKGKSDRDEPFVSARRYASMDEGPGFGANLAMIVAEGAIGRGESSDGFDDPTIGSNTVTEAFREAREAEVKGILFRVDSPGGSYIASDVMRREVELTRDAGIPVVVSMGNVAASGGYFIAMDADKIIAESGTITGSIGVLAGRFALRKFYKGFLGVSFDTYETSEAAGIFSSLDMPNELHKQRLAKAIDRIYVDFVTKAAAGRKTSYEEMHAVAQGRVWSGQDAFEHGLVDELGGMRVAMARLEELAGVAEAEAEYQVYPKPKTGFELFVEAMGGEARLPAELRELAGTVRRLGLNPGEGVLLLPYVPRL